MTHHSRWGHSAAVLAMLGATLASACGGDSDPGREASPPTGEAPDQAAVVARVDDIDPADVLVEQTVSVPERPDDEVTLAVHSLRVTGEVMTLRLVVTPHFDSAGPAEAVTLFEVLGRRAFSPILVDMVNLKQYSVISDPPHYWTSGAADIRAANGEPMLAWAVFAAPEDDIDTIEVRVTEWWPPFLDVPIER